MKFAVLVFPGSNCDADLYHAIEDVCHENAEYVPYTATSLAGFDTVLVPGAFHTAIIYAVVRLPSWHRL